VARFLSSRTKDQNIGYIAEYLTAVGIDLKEVRVVGDEERAILDALNELRHRYTYVFTTGGIGPTHGDITADCVAQVFGVPIDGDPRQNGTQRSLTGRTLFDRSCCHARKNPLKRAGSSSRPFDSLDLISGGSVDDGNGPRRVHRSCTMNLGHHDGSAFSALLAPNSSRRLHALAGVGLRWF